MLAKRTCKIWWTISNMEIISIKKAPWTNRRNRKRKIEKSMSIWSSGFWTIFLNMDLPTSQKRTIWARNWPRWQRQLILGSNRGRIGELERKWPLKVPKERIWKLKIASKTNRCWKFATTGTILKNIAPRSIQSNSWWINRPAANLNASIRRDSAGS